MSHYSWETGTLTLPAKAVAGTRALLRQTHNDLREEAWTKMLAFHSEHAHLSPPKYDNAIYHQLGNQPDPASSLAMHSLRRSIAPALLALDKVTPAPTRESMDGTVPKATMRTTEFPILAPDAVPVGTVQFTGRELYWEVPMENGGPPEDTRSGPTGKALFAHLDQVTWTRGSGGYGVGNDEYNDGGGGIGGGGNYLTFHYGPLARKQIMETLDAQRETYRELLLTPGDHAG